MRTRVRKKSEDVVKVARPTVPLGRGGVGGSRVGAGRKNLYGEPMSEYISVRVDEDQGRAIGAWCLTRRISPVTLMREVGLEVCGARHLGVGLDKIAGDPRRPLMGAASVAVKVTPNQKEAISAYCEERQVKPGTLLREATLRHIGATELGAAHRAERLASAIG